MRRYGLMAAALLLCGLLSAQVRNEIRVPDIPGYTTLKGDMHIHTVFSDGSVWPTTRVDECVMDGVDVLCMTDHVDSRLHKYIKDGTLNPDKVNRNTAYEMAAKYAKGKGVIVVRGGEISSQIMPPGHLNVLFTTDNEPIGAAMDAAGRDHQPAGADAALKVAKSQGAFVTWNHPHWCRQAPNVTRIYPEHLQYIKDGVINAIEAYNWWDGFSKEAFRWALEYNLTLVSGTDSHHPMFSDINTKAGELRPVTLIFARERNEKGVREALEAHRTAIFAENNVYGKEEWLTALLSACVEVEKVSKSKTKLTVELYNNSSIPVLLDKAPGSEQWQIARHVVLHPFEHQTLTLYRLDNTKPLEASDFDFHYTVSNFWTEPDVNLHWVLSIHK